MVKKGLRILSKNPNWKGGRTITSQGYVKIKSPTHPRGGRDGYVYEHILVMEHALARSLRNCEQVHHINHLKHDNRLENLRVVASQHHHGVLHRHSLHNQGKYTYRVPGEDNPIIFCACGCGEAFHKFTAKGRPRFYIKGSHALIAWSIAQERRAGV